MIEVKNLRKTFPHKDTQNKKAEKVAVENLSLTIGTGEIFGLLGPNGAGKTTTIRMLTMLSRPTSGEILYDGQTHRQCGRCPSNQADDRRRSPKPEL